MTTLNRALGSIGKKCFVDNYYDFKNCADKNELAKKLLDNNCNAVSLSAQLTRINYALWIFENNLEKEALEIIINSNRLDDKTKNKAKFLIQTLCECEENLMLDWNGNGKIDPVDIGVSVATESETKEETPRADNKKANAGCLTTIIMTICIVLAIISLIF